MTSLELKDDLSIRAIRRGLDVLQAVNRAGSMRLTDISKATGLPFPTVSRIVDTLVDAGMLEREPARRFYRPTALVQTLAVGYKEDHELVALARPHIVALCKLVGWPITVTTRVGNNMMVRDSTHKLTTLTFSNYAPGYTLPLLECSAGKAYLAFCDEDERSIVISSLKQLQSAPDKMAQLLLSDEAQFLGDIRAKGYASHAYNQYTENPGKTSSLAVPLFIGGKLAGGMGLVFFSSVMTVAQAADRYLNAMKATADLISVDSSGDARERAVSSPAG